MMPGAAHSLCTVLRPLHLSPGPMHRPRCGLRIQRYSAVVSFIRKHAPAPVFADNRYPVAGHIKGGGGSGVGGGPPLRRHGLVRDRSDMPAISGAAQARKTSWISRQKWSPVQHAVDRIGMPKCDDIHLLLLRSNISNFGIPNSVFKRYIACRFIELGNANRRRELPRRSKLVKSSE